MSNVRPTSMNTTSTPSHSARTSVRRSFHAGNRVPSEPLSLRSRFARAVRALPAGAPLALCSERASPSRARSVPLPKQSIQNRVFVRAPSFGQENVPSAAVREVSRSCFCRSTSTAAVRSRVSQAAPLHRSWCRPPRPNPSVEGTVKRLRLLSAPHLER